MNRKTALATVRAEYAEHGEETTVAMRIFMENRLSYGAFMGARREGMRIYQKAQKQ